MSLSDLEIGEYQLYRGSHPCEEDVRLVRRRHWKGSRWSISAKGQVLGKDRNWYLEGLPSSRTEGFINLTRWDDPEEALVFWEQYAAKYAVMITVRGQACTLLDWERIFQEIGEAIG